MTLDFMDVLTIRLIDTFLCCNGYKARPERPTSSSSPVIAASEEEKIKKENILLHTLLGEPTEQEKPEDEAINDETQSDDINSDRRSPTLKQLAEQYMEKNPHKEINFATIVTKAPLTKDESFVATDGKDVILETSNQCSFDSCEAKLLTKESSYESSSDEIYSVCSRPRSNQEKRITDYCGSGGEISTCSTIRSVPMLENGTSSKDSSSLHKYESYPELDTDAEQVKIELQIRLREQRKARRSKTLFSFRSKKVKDDDVNQNQDNKSINKSYSSLSESSLNRQSSLKQMQRLFKKVEKDDQKK